MGTSCNYCKFLLFLLLAACNASDDAGSKSTGSAVSAANSNSSVVFDAAGDPAERAGIGGQHASDTGSSGHDEPADRGKVDVCHLPPGNPGNAHTISVSINALNAHLGHGDSEGICEHELKTAAEIDPPEVTVDPTLVPSASQIAGIDGGPMRNLLLMNSDIGAGYQFDFVEDEIYLITDSADELAGLMSRWGASLLFEIVPPSNGSTTDPVKMYLLNVDPSAADTSTLNEDLAMLDSTMHGKHQVSSESGLKLLALVVSEIKNQGLNVGINVLLKSQGLAERSTREAALGVNEASFVYTRNGFEWSYMERDPDVPGDDLWPLDTGVAEALRVVEANGSLSNRVKALIADGGFYPNDDFPDFTSIGALRTPNPDPTNCGSAGPISATCSSHGTHVSLSGFGLPDNEFGTFGPGGPVTDLILLQSPSVDFAAIVRFITESLPAALSERPDIINVSASVAIPWGWCFLACEPMDFLAGILDDAGIIFVAAAGNAGINVDATDEICIPFCVRFEEAAIIPCETDNVICVGAHVFDRSIRTSYSNFGNYADNNSVDIFAPGDVYSVTALNADNTSTSPVDDLQVIRGTSFATPFVAGVLALTWASNPSQTDDDVKNCVLSSAFTQSFTGEPRRINALGAVQCAMGGTHPFIQITAPADGGRFRRGVQAIELSADADDLEDGLALSIGWTSSLDGFLGNTAPGGILNLGPLRLRIGDHEICAGTTDSSARSARDCVDIRVVGARPVVNILQPRIDDVFTQSSNITLSASIFDPDGPTPTDIRWFIHPSFTPTGPPVATGVLLASIPASGYAPGEYTVTLDVVDSDGNFEQRFVRPIIIIEDPANAFPVIAITQPTGGQTFFSGDGGPVTIPLSAVVSDSEDGSIPFDQIDWFVSADGGPEIPLTVSSLRICIRFDPFGGCELFGTTYSVELGPVGSNTLTRHAIKGRVQDSAGQQNLESNGRVTIFINQFI